MTGKTIEAMLGEVMLVIDPPGDLYKEFFTDAYRTPEDRKRVLRLAVRVIQKGLRDDAKRTADRQRRKKKRAARNRRA